MDTLLHRSERLVDLQTAGQMFVDDCRDSSMDDPLVDEDYRICHLIPGPELTHRGHVLIVDLEDTTATGRADLLNQPVFSWNKSIRDPVVTKVENKIINTSECFPPALTLLALDYIDKGYGEGDGIYDEFVRKIGALFYCQATPMTSKSMQRRRELGYISETPSNRMWQLVITS